MKRMKRQLKKPANPLFEEWLIAWQREAAEQGSELQYTLTKAIRSLKKYPFPLLSGKECIILDSFGKKICEMLDKRMIDFRKMVTDEEWTTIMQGGYVSTLEPRIVKKKAGSSTVADIAISSGDEILSMDTAGVAKSKSLIGRSKEYVPKLRSGGYAILMALNASSLDSLDKNHLQKEAQSLSDVSFSKPQPGSFYTAWSSVATLLKHDLIGKTSKPIKYYLTDRGRNLAQRLVNAPSNHSMVSKKSPVKKCHDEQINTQVVRISDSDTDASSVITKQTEHSFETLILGHDAEPPIHQQPFTKSPTSKKIIKKRDLIAKKIICDGSQYAPPGCDSVPIDKPSSSLEETTFFMPGRFDVILLIDIHETEMKGKQRVDTSVPELRRQGIMCETRHLSVGDFVWICRDRITNAELLLPFVLERKRMDDFAASIKDGRFHEQKFRLKQCGLNNVIYLVERFGKDSQRLGLPLPTLQQAAANTQVVDGFMVNFTASHDDSLLYLVCVTKLLTEKFKSKTLFSCSKSQLVEPDLSSDVISLLSFMEFNRSSTKVKNWTVKDMLIKQLVQLKGLSVEKASAIALRFPTVRALMTAFESSGEKEIAELHCGPLRRIGPATAQTLHQFYTQNKLP